MSVGVALGPAEASGLALAESVAATSVAGGAAAVGDPLAGAPELVGAVGDGLGEGSVDLDGAVELANTPVMVGGAEEFTVAAAES